MIEAKRILFCVYLSLHDGFVIDSLEYGETGGDTVVAITPLTEEQLQPFQIICVDSL